jgi:hypothetical protein
MATFLPQDAAFEGFRLTREHPRAVLIWAAFNLALSVLLAVLIISMGGERLMALEAAAAQNDADPALALETLRQLIPLYAVLLPIGLIAPAVMTAAVYRVVLGDPAGRTSYLRLGADEFRLVLLFLIYVLLTMAMVFGLALVGGIVTTLAVLAVGGPTGGLIGAGVGLFVFGLLIYVAVRLSLGPVISFHEHRLAVFASWKMTRGLFWKLLGTYVLAVATVIVVMLLATIILAAVVAIGTGGDLEATGRMFSPNFSSIGAYFTATTVISAVFNAVLNAVYYAVLSAPGAIIYRTLTTEDDPAAMI